MQSFSMIRSHSHQILMTLTFRHQLRLHTTKIFLETDSNILYSETFIPFWMEHSLAPTNSRAQTTP